jgi:Ca2+-binding EF-hand superfamily protein
MHRKCKLSQINIRDAFRCIDKFGKGFITLEDYYNFFEEFYTEDLPVSTEEIDYLFTRHDKEKIGRVTEASFLKELMPLDDYIVID